MSYAQAKLAVDVAQEERWKETQAADAERARQKEEESKSFWGTIGKVVGSVIAGPVGYVVGEYVGREGADYLIDSESQFVDEGKFNRSATRTYNDDLEAWDSDADWADVLDTAKSSIFAFNAAGGITDEGLDFSVDMTKWMTKDGPKTSGEIVSSFFGSDKTAVAAPEIPDVATPELNITEKATYTASPTDIEAVAEAVTIAPLNVPAVDYTSYGTFDEAFSAASIAGEETFIWHGQLYKVAFDDLTLAGATVGDDPTMFSREGY